MLLDIVFSFGLDEVLDVRDVFVHLRIDFNFLLYLLEERNQVLESFLHGNGD